MNDKLFVSLINNAALLLSLGLVYDMLYRGKREALPVLNKIFSGLIIGVIAIVLMATPAKWENGIIFDTRTILLSLTGLFFGTIPTILAMAVAGTYRLNLGGGGAPMGIATIISSGLIGIAWRHYRFRESKKLSLTELYLFGGVVHIAMILCMFLLPQEVIQKTISTLALPIIIIYPAGSALLGNLLLGRQRRHRIEEALQNSTYRFDQLAEQSLTVIWEINSAGLYTYISSAAEAVFGYRPEELCGKKHFYDIHPEEGREGFKEAAFTIIKSKADFKYLVNPIQTKNGKIIWVSTNGIPMVAEDGSLLGYRGSDKDITERKLIEEVQIFLATTSILNRDEPFFHSLAQFLAVKLDMFFVCIDVLEGDGLTARTLAVWCDGHFEDNVTYALKDTPCGDVVGKDVCCFPSSVCQFFPRDQVLQDLKAESYVGVTLFSCTGQPIGLIAVIGRTPLTDRTLVEKIMKIVAMRSAGELERLVVEDELRESEARFRAVAESAHDAIITVDSIGIVCSWNRAAERIFGHTEEEMIGKDLTSIVPPNYVEKHLGGMQRVVQGGEHRVIGKTVEMHGLHKSGKEFPLELSLAKWKTPSGEYFTGIIRDLTERRQAEEALMQSEDKYRTLFEDSRDMIFISTYDGRFIDVNPAGVELLRYPSKEALMSVAIRDTYADPNDRSRFLSLLSEHDYVADFVTKLQRKDGQQIEVSISASVARDDQGKVTEMRGIIRDITEHRKIEEQLRQSQKMESIGTLAGGVAHDFNNILTAIIGYGQLAVRKMESDNPYRKNIEHMLEAADKAVYLTQGLLSFSRKQMSNMNHVELNELLKKTEMFLRRVIGEDIEFRTNLHRSPIIISADSNQIEQILMNLATNARDAMPKGGVLTITTDQMKIDKEFTRNHGYGTPGSYGLITVSDTGMGMTEDTRQRIFEPFFTTKEVGKGTGLGLAIIYGIIKQHDGYIDVYSEPGEGTTFRIYLPLIGVVVKETAMADEPTYPARGTETILLAEDDDMLRKLSKTVLEEFGYEVIEAVDGEDAISKFADNKDRIDLLLTDLIMPKKSGKEAYDEIRKMRSNIKTIFASGYSPDIVQDKASLGNDVIIVFKPITPLDLLRKVREVLDKRNT